MKYIIIRCPFCRRYTYAPKGQKTRLCAYCGRTIRIREWKIEVSNPKEARAYVVALNTGKEDIEKMMSAKKVDISRYLKDSNSRNNEKGESLASKSKLARLIEAIKSGEHTINEILKICEQNGLSREWVIKNIEKLEREGKIYYPQPGIVAPTGLLLATSIRKCDEEKVIAALKKLGSASPIEISEKSGVDKETTEKILIKLYHEGRIYKVKAGIYSLI